MENIKTHYSIEGSNALQSKPRDNIIEFPAQSLISKNEADISFEVKTSRSPFIQSLKYGSVKGRSFNLAKPWQAILASSAFLAFALFCVYFFH